MEITLAGNKRTIRTIFTGQISMNHEFCIVDEINSLMNQGYRCYLEEEFVIVPPPAKYKRKGGRYMSVDIYALRDGSEIITEVGTLSYGYEAKDRLMMLKELRPNAKIVHVMQWKCYGLNEDLMWRLARERQRIMDSYGSWDSMRESLLRNLDSKIWDLDKRSFWL